MSIITISSNSGELSEKIGARVAPILEYRTIDHATLINNTSKKYSVPSKKLTQSIEDTVSFFGLSSDSRKKYIAYIQATLAHSFIKDNIIYTGPIGHLLIQGISHVMKVYVAEPMEEQIRHVIEKRGVTAKKAAKIITRQQNYHHRWVQEIFGAEDPLPSNFDLTIDLARVNQEEACGLIVDTIKSRRFQAMTYSRKRMEDQELACRIKARLVDMDPWAKVEVLHGAVTIYIQKNGTKTKQTKLIEKRIGALDDVHELQIHIREGLFFRR